MCIQFQMVCTCRRIVCQSTLAGSCLIFDSWCFSILHSFCCCVGSFPPSFLCLDRSRYPCKKLCIVLHISFIFSYPRLYGLPKTLPQLCLSKIQTTWKNAVMRVLLQLKSMHSSLGKSNQVTFVSWMEK